jgi:hypothetical protein
VGHHTNESTGFDRSDVGDAKGISHEDASFLLRPRVFESRLELHKNACSELANVFAAGAQIGVFHSIKDPHLLGVRRSSVHGAASGFHKQHIIDYRRGRIAIVDQGRLRAARCDCYALMKRQYDSFLN